MPPSPAGADQRVRRIGVDLDNTLCDYSRVFGPIAVELGLASPSLANASKRVVKDHLMGGPGGEHAWMRLQGQVYGRFLPRAAPYPGAVETLKGFVADGAQVKIVSHKTRRGHFDEHGVDLWEAAQSWLDANGLLSFGLALEDVHFLETRDEKVARIAALACDVFVDDLPEVLRHPAFPAGATPIWFHGPGPVSADGEGLVGFETWAEVERAVRSALRF
jgi:hypothetical protein